MRSVLFVTLLLFVLTTSTMAQKQTFMRIYTLSGKTLAKGFYSGSTDSSVMVSKNNKKVEIPVSQIGVIKLGRGSVKGPLIGGVFGAAVFGTIGATRTPQGNPPASMSLYRWTNFKTGFFFGGLAGALTGILIQGSKKNNSYTINGSNTKWLEQRNAFQKLPTINE